MRTRSAAVLALAAIFAIAACQPAAQPTPTPAAPTPPTDATPTAPAEATPTAPAEATPTAPAESPSVEVRIGVVTDVGRLDDASFNQFSNQGAVDAAAQLGTTHRVIVTEDIADYANNINTLVSEGFNVIVTIGFLLGTDTTVAAKANPDVFFIGIDQFICIDENADPDPTFACAGDAATLLPNYQAPQFAEAEAGYLAGIIAAHLSESGVIGSVRGTDVPAVVAFREGYENGARSVNPDIQTLSVESDPNPVIGFDNPARGREIASQMIDQGADVIFQIAGNTGRGALEVACDRGIWGIGVDVDQHESLPDLAGCIVTSAEKKLYTTVFEVIMSIAFDRFEPGNFPYNAASDPPAIGLSPFHEHEDAVPDQAKADVEAAFEAMRAGTLDPRATPAP